MSKRGTSRFLCSPLATLAEALAQATTERLRGFVRKAERLHDELDTTAAYPLDYLAWRITGQRHFADSEEELLPGEAVAADLRLLIGVLSRKAPTPIAEEPAATQDELAIRLNVSTKTLARWRARGLRWRWVTRGVGTAEARPELGFAPEAVERFTAAHARLVEKAGRFTQMSADDRAKLLRRARRLAAASGASLNQVALHLSKRSGRALETVRQLLIQHDREHADEPIFVDRTGPLSPRDRRLIARAYRMRVPVTKMALRFRRTRTTIYRAIHQRRAATLLRVRLDFTPSPTFRRDDADAVFLRPLPPPADELPATADPMLDLPPELRPLYRRALPDPDAAESMIVRRHFLRYKAETLRGTLNPSDPRAGDLDRIEAWLRDAAAVRDRVVLDHLPVVLAVARRHLASGPTAGGVNARLLELIELGQEVLIDAVETYDYTRGAPGRGRGFEAYLTFLLMRAFAQEASVARRAARKLSGIEALRRLRTRAGESGVTLALE